MRLSRHLHEPVNIAIMKREILIEWDFNSLNHISKHNVSEKEVEIAMNGAILTRNTSRNGEKLKEVIGESHGRILFVVLKLDGDKYKVITARDATRAETPFQFVLVNKI